MAITNRLTNLDVSVFSLNGDYNGDLKDCSISIEVETEDARALRDEFKYPYATGRSWKLEASVFVAPTAALVALAATGTAIVNVSFDSGGNSYAGQGLITSGTHKVGRGLQDQQITIEGQGALTIS